MKTRWGEDLRPPRKPRALSAPARGEAIRRAVDRCCKRHLPAAPDLLRGARRFLQQWDRSSRVQRSQILGALADQLLVNAHGDIIQHHNSTGLDGFRVMESGKGTEVQWGQPQTAPGLEGRLVTGDFYHPSCSVEGRNEIVSILGGGSIRANDELPAEFVAGDTNATTHPADTSRCLDPGKAQMRTTNPPNFLELLGPHAGLLSTRVVSHLQTSYACGHATGPCLRVATLLAESTVNTASRGDSSGDGDSDGFSGTSSGIVQQLATPGVVNIALRVIAADEEPSAIKENNNGELSMESNRAQALRLLLAIARAGGRRAKECMTCSAEFSCCGASGSSVNNAECGKGDAVGVTINVLCRPGCGAETQIVGSDLLAELGVGNPVGCGKVWNAVLFLLGCEKEETIVELQAVGCRVAVELLRRSNPCRGSSTGVRGFASSSRLLRQQEEPRSPRFASGLNGFNENSNTRRQDGNVLSSGRFRPELILVPSVLNLAIFSSSSKARDAAEELAMSLASVPGTCCYLVVAGLTGVMGIFSGVDRGAPVAWIQGNEGIKRRASLGKGRNDALACEGINGLRSDGGGDHEAEERGSILAHVDVDSVLPDVDGTLQYCDDGCGSADGGEEGLGIGSSVKAQSGPSPKQDQHSSPTQGVAGSFDATRRAVELLRRVCLTVNGDHVCRALASAVAPIAVFDLILGPLPPTRENLLHSDVEHRRRHFETVAGCVEDGNRAFVTQATGVDTGAGAVTLEGDQTMIRRHVREEERRQRGKPPQCSQDRCCDSGNGPRCPTSASSILFNLAAEVLVAMYCRDGGTVTHATLGDLPSRKHFHRGDNSRGLSDSLNSLVGGKPNSEDQRGDGDEKTCYLRDDIDAALEGCPRLLHYLRNADIAALTRAFAGGGVRQQSERGRGAEREGDEAGSELDEITTLYENIISFRTSPRQLHHPEENNASLLSPCRWADFNCRHELHGDDGGKLAAQCVQRGAGRVPPATRHHDGDTREKVPPRRRGGDSWRRDPPQKPVDMTQRQAFQSLGALKVTERKGEACAALPPSSPCPQNVHLGSQEQRWSRYGRQERQCERPPPWPVALVRGVSRTHNPPFACEQTKQRMT